LVANTCLIALTLCIYTFIDQHTSIEFILLINLCLGFLSSLQMASINSMAFADISKNDSSMASTISSSMQQMTMNFGLASGALIAGFFLQNTDVNAADKTITAVHQSFVALALLTVFSATWFLYLKNSDGSQISGHR
jgi:predicted MFS family arabinose efflux permease